MQFKESESRVKSMAMIHQMLYEQENFAEIDFGLYLKRLVRYLANNYQDQDKTIKTEVHVDDIRFEIDTAVPCALIVNELITNAYKHACKGKTDCTVYVSLSKEGSFFKLVVSDNGPGLPPGFDMKKARSLGISLIKGLTDQLKGSIEIQQNEGTVFEILFKEARKRQPLESFST